MTWGPWSRAAFMVPTCAECDRDILEKVDGSCQVIMELPDGTFERCNRPLNDQGPPPPVAHRWHGGWDHLVDPFRDKGEHDCLCGHPRHEDFCIPCMNGSHGSPMGRANHRYRAGRIRLDHRPHP